MFKTLVTMHSAEIGLLLFFISFLVIAAWTVTRTRKEVDDWSNLPLSNANGKEPTKSDGVNRHD